MTPGVELGALPRDADGPVFAEPWQAQAFAMAVLLHEQGLFTWPEWAATLAAEIASAPAIDDPVDGSAYYRHWLAALERLVVARGVASESNLAGLAAAWQTAAAATPHGRPIELPPEVQSAAKQ
ncbi:MAG TPA: nitrile hydratase accessory protein [Geminicoccaceae bacterium]|jgi:nitrile hydratase accessory protein|nr:nitrile hydratase accessory protein [Geminicoccaceae bacterium]